MELRCLRLVGPLLLATPSLGIAQSPRVPAVRLAKPPIVDGEVGADEWKDAPRMTGFVDPFTGRPAAEQTEAWIGYDDAGLYVAFRCLDTNPEAMMVVHDRLKRMGVDRALARAGAKQGDRVRIGTLGFEYDEA